MSSTASLLWRFVLVVIAGHAISFADDPPLHLLVDQRLAPVSGIDAPQCSDAEFLRRVSLDLIGMPPGPDEARAFIDDTAPDKRERLIDRLLESVHYPRHMASVLDLMLMERRANTHVSADEWQAWLVKSVRDNKPWNVLARELLSADGEDPATRPAARFMLDRAAESHLLTRDIGRVFFGRDLQCAQCHDHPLVDDYLQADYHGLLAFVAASSLQTLKEGDKEKTVLAEKAGSDASFKSVLMGIPHRTGARLPDGVSVQEPFLLPGEEYKTAPADNVKSVPQFSRRLKLAETATDGSNIAFNENIANRLWAHMFGRGLVHPLDLHHADNPATDPELLRLLAEQFVTMNFDIRAFLKQLAMTKAYQRGFDAPADPLTVAAEAAELAAALSQNLPSAEEQAKQSASEYAALTEAWYAAEAVALPVATEVDTARNQYAEARKKLDEATTALVAAKAGLTAKESAATALQQAVTALEQAAQAIPGDAEITDATKKLTAKLQQAKAEIPGLTKSVEELTAALAAPTEALTNAKPPLDAAVARLAPLNAAVLDAEQKMLVARRRAAVHAGAVRSLQQRLETANLIAQLPVTQQAIVAARQMVADREGDVAAAQQQLSEYAAVVSKAEANASAAAEPVAAAQAVVTAAQGEHNKRVAEASSIAAAFTSADAARQKIPDDAVLTEVAAKLQERKAVAESLTAETQKNVAAALAEQQAVADAVAAVQQELSAVRAERDVRQQAVDSAAESLVAARAEVEARTAEFETSLASLTDRWTKDFTVSSLKPLTPEQMCWTIFKVTGVYDAYWAAEVAELDKSSPLTDEQKQDPAAIAARDIELEQRTFDKLKGNVGTFVTYYGAAAGQPQTDFFATADQALFAANGGSINSWVSPGNTATNRVIQQNDPKLAAEALYLSVLTRLPTEEETADVVNYLAARESDRPVASQELVWALLNSAEFRFNH
ncbi:MAG: DUF1549 domain-containing protein [Planctomycetaceae bacterium]